jgi:dTDP-D-glucose 4,6-dehydratase
MIREMVAINYPKVRTVVPVYREERKGDMKFSRADISKANRLLGYYPLYRVRQGLEKTVDWYVSKGSGEFEKNLPEQSQSPRTKDQSIQPAGNSMANVAEIIC